MAQQQMDRRGFFGVMAGVAVSSVAGCASGPSRQPAASFDPRQREVPTPPAIKSMQDEFQQKVQGDAKRLNGDMLKAEIDAQMRSNNPHYVSSLLEELQDPVKHGTGKFADALRHVYSTYPAMRSHCYERVAKEQTARLGNRTPDILIEFAAIEPEKGRVLANIIEKETRVNGFVAQRGFPEVAKSMRDMSDRVLGVPVRR